MFEQLKQGLSSYIDSQLYKTDISPLTTDYIHITNVGKTKSRNRNILVCLLCFNYDKYALAPDQMKTPHLHDT